MLMPPRVENSKPTFLMSLTTSAVSIRILEVAVAVGHDAAELLPVHRVVVVLAELVGSARLKITRPTVVSIRLISPPSRSVRTDDQRLQIDRAGVVGES